MPRWKTVLAIIWLGVTVAGAIHLVWTFNDPTHIEVPSHFDIIVDNNPYYYGTGVLQVVVPFGINLICLHFAAERWFKRSV
jgi:hypothetical protein